MNSNEYYFDGSGDLSFFMEKVFFQVKIQQLNDGTSKIIGKTKIPIKKSYVTYSFSEFSIVSQEGRRLHLHGIGPLNWLVEILIEDHLEQKMNQILLRESQNLLSGVAGKVSVVDYLYIHVKK